MANEYSVKQMTLNKEFIKGLKKAMPIALGYFPVSFTFGMMATSGGIHPLIATMISVTNLTSAGQFAGTNLILAGAPFVEIAMTTLIINIRYSLMSLALSQKIQSMGYLKKMILAFGITDETFALASLEEEKISFMKMLGIITGPFIGWSLGTFFGAYACTLLSDKLQQALGIALYGMFLAIVIPETKKDRAILKIVILASSISLLLYYLPIVAWLTSGWKIIASTVLASSVGAILYPRRGEVE